MDSKNFIEEFIEQDLADGKVNKIVTRFPPEPNGYLHIGHAKALCINFGVKEKYNGICNLRFDDTNPAKEDVEYMESIKRDIEWLGFKWDGLYNASDYFEKMYECAVKLIKDGKAYVCDLTADEISATRGSFGVAGTESPFRNRSVEENLALFERMRAGEFADGEKVLRAKIDMSSPNINMRDPVIYRICHATHPHTGDKWCIYPMYDFAHPIEDAVEGISHSLCSLEFENHRPLYDWVTENCGFDPRPRQIEFARLNLTHAVMSKRFIKKLVDEKIVWGWDDPRLSTLCGIRERGYTPAAIRDFCARIGVAKADSEVDISILEHCVREDLNAHAQRAMVVTKPLKLIIDNYPEDKTEDMYIENAFCEGGRLPHEEQCDEYHAAAGKGGVIPTASLYWPRQMAQTDDRAHAKGTMVRDRRFKYIHRTSGEHELYDLERDPLEEENLYGREDLARETARLRMAMLDWYQATCDVVPRQYDRRISPELLWEKLRSQCPPGAEEEIRGMIFAGAGPAMINARLGALRREKERRGVSQE